jgi:predicted nucleotidyltransferase
LNTGDLALGFSPLDLTLQREGKYNLCRRLLVNSDIDSKLSSPQRRGIKVYYPKEETMGRNKEEILNQLQEHRDVIRAYGVRRLGLFGSFVRGEQKENSDLDFVVEFERKSFDAYMDLKQYLEDLFHCRVDLVISDAIKPRLRQLILEEAAHVSGL